MGDLDLVVEASWSRAIRPASGGVSLDVAVVPGSSESRFPAGFDPWRGRLQAKVRAPPEEGQANAELVGLVASALGIAPSRVTVTSGHTSRRKTVRIEGLDEATALRRLGKGFNK